jgi:hypothetical protein
MKRRLFNVAALTLAISSFALAQAPSIAGKWTAQVMGRGGQATERIYDFKQTGMTFTGTYPGFQGAETQIKDGTIAADGKVAFTVVNNFGGNTIEQKWTGELAGDTLKLAYNPPAPPAGAEPPAGGRGGRGGGPQAFEAKRVK